MILRPFFRQDMKRVGSIAFSAASQFYIAHAAERLFLHSLPAKLQPDFPGSKILRRLVRRHSSRNQQHLIEGQQAGKFLRNVKMPQMNGIEGAAKHPQTFPAHTCLAALGS